MNNKKFKRTIITAALPYANGPVHIGHLAGVYVPADIYARYLRLTGKEVLFVSGSDENGVPVTKRAREEGCSVQDIVDRYHTLIRNSFEGFGISFDIYSRTTSPTHRKFASEFFSTLNQKGEFIELTSEQYYDEQEQEFLVDKYIKGECPRCHYPEAYGNECPGCGCTLSPEELINPVSEFNNWPVKRKTRHWYLPLDKHQDWLERWIYDNHSDWRNTVLRQCRSWFQEGLRPRAVTRDLKWGIPVPVDGADGKVLYVWFDAPIGYISNTKELCDKDPERWGTWQKWWKSDDTRLIHFIGKDNIVFHSIIFPAMLKAHGEYILPDNIPANEFLNLEGNKISTSKNYAIWLNEYLEDLPGRQDELRYVLTANAPKTKDNDFTWEDFQAHCNNELVAVYGNFINRALQLTQKYYDGIVPESGLFTEADKNLLDQVQKALDKCSELIEGFHFRDAQKEILNLARFGNKYITESEPWKLIKTDPERVKTIIYISLQIAGKLSIGFEPFLPFSSKRLREYLNITEFKWPDLNKTELIKAGTQLNKPNLLFRKVEEAAIQLQTEKLHDTVVRNLENQKSKGGTVIL